MFSSAVVVILALSALAVFSGNSQAGQLQHGSDHHQPHPHPNKLNRLPCDIYAKGGTPCVAAHSTTRALFSKYSGRLYRIQRRSDGLSMDVGTLTAGGYANAAAQDTFCANTSCTITGIYDQTANANHLSIEGPGGAGGQDVGANAAALPIMAGGHKVYGVYVSAGVGYRNNLTTGVATGSQPEGMYMVTEGTHYNDRCCFDYGNAETNTLDTGNGHMDAINFGTGCWFSCPQGPGPIVQADLENGLFQGGDGTWPTNTGRSSAFVTAVLKNNGTTTYAIKDGNAQSGALATRYDGPLPSQPGYRPMQREGAIVLGTGGDNSNGSVGSFFEGVMTAGYPTNSAENDVQANIVSVGYSKSTTFPANDATYTVTNVNSGKVLDAVNCGTAHGTPVDLWDSLGNPCQKWRFTNAPNGTWTITNVNSGKVLDALNCGQNGGTRVDLWDSLGNKCQQWAVIPGGNNSYEIIPENSGMVLDALNCGTANGTPVDLFQALNNNCQLWTIKP